MWLLWLALTASMELIPELAFVIVPLILLYLGIRYWFISLPLVVVAFVGLMWEPFSAGFERGLRHAEAERGQPHALLGYPPR